MSTRTKQKAFKNMIEEFEIRVGDGFFTAEVETHKWNGEDFVCVSTYQSPIFRLFKKIEKLLN